MKVHQRRTALVMIAGLGSILAVSACGSTSEAPAAGSASSSASVTSSTAPSASPSSPSSPSSTSSPASSAPASTSMAAAASITIKDFMFDVPASVAPGAMVMITNDDGEAHTVTSKDGGFDVKVFGSGRTAMLTAPSKPGSYSLTCDFHANMSGTLVVK